MVFAEIESQSRTEGGWNMHIAIALIMALLVTAGVLWFFFAPRKAYRAPLRDGVQEAVVEVKGGYSPAVIEAEAGVRSAGCWRVAAADRRSIVKRHSRLPPRRSVSLDS